VSSSIPLNTLRATSALTLSPAEIHLWLSFPDEVRGSGLLEKYESMLCESERRRHAILRPEKDRVRHVITQALIRTVLSRYVPVKPDQWSFGENALGRPKLSNEAQGSGAISFNISHTDSLIILGVTSHHALGVGTENVSTRSVPLGVADRYFSWHEVATLRALPETLQHDRFLQYFALKESYVNAQAEGPSVPLKHFSFELTPGDGISVSFNVEMDDRPNRWRFWLLRPSAEHVIAVCAQNANDMAPKLISRKIVPLEREELLAPAVIRRSA
jgi:4'-phosphopantetheinyl transferase